MQRRARNIPPRSGSSQCGFEHGPSSSGFVWANGLEIDDDWKCLCSWRPWRRCLSKESKFKVGWVWGSEANFLTDSGWPWDDPPPRKRKRRARKAKRHEKRPKWSAGGVKRRNWNQLHCVLARGVDWFLVAPSSRRIVRANNDVVFEIRTTPDRRRYFR